MAAALNVRPLPVDHGLGTLRMLRLLGWQTYTVGRFAGLGVIVAAVRDGIVLEADGDDLEEAAAVLLAKAREEGPRGAR